MKKSDLIREMKKRRIYHHFEGGWIWCDESNMARSNFLFLKRNGFKFSDKRKRMYKVFPKMNRTLSKGLYSAPSKCGVRRRKR